MDIEVEWQDEGYEILYNCAATQEFKEEAGEVLYNMFESDELKEFVEQNREADHGICQVTATPSITPDGVLCIRVDAVSSSDSEYSSVEHLFAMVYSRCENSKNESLKKMGEEFFKLKENLDELYDDEQLDDNEYGTRLLSACCGVLLAMSLYEDPTNDFMKFQLAARRLIKEVTQELEIDYDGKPLVKESERLDESGLEIYAFDKLDTLIDAAAFCKEGEVYKDGERYLLLTFKTPELIEMGSEILHANEDMILRIKEIKDRLCSVSDLKAIV